MKKSIIGLLVGLACSVGGAERPNILLMMVDDLGFADFGCYGSEIETPRIDKLAAEGLRFSQFYNTAKCHSSRVCLLSGLYCNQAGNTKLNRATTIAEVLGKAGYFTSMAGKWHLDKQPTDFGFQRYWGHLSGATDFFVGDNTFRLNGGEWNEFGDDFYTTDANVDWTMKFLDEALETGKPFFHYIAFNAPHYPLQAPKEDIRKYLGRYDAGWGAIRKARFEKQKQLGIFPQDMKLPPLPEHVPGWESMTVHQREFERFRMAIFAAMVDRIDQNIGRLVDYLEKKGQLENTLIMLCSDNGACPFERSKNIDIPPWEGKSYYLYDASWATVGNTPLKHYKQTQHEGGISSPLIVHWPGNLKNTGGWVRSPGHLVDFMATCIDVGGAQYPTAINIEPLQGKSLVPLFRGIDQPRHDEIYFEFSGCRALRMGDWKLVSFYKSKWELYNLAEDRCEQTDLAGTYPERVAAMSARWHELASGTDKLPEKKSGPVSGQPSPGSKSSWHDPAVFKSWEKPVF
ncbi:Arylsulfatase [Pontiella desulfatans]|uniref:Arylsulfatase n=1 Tax=Pontiella desulfatans TaxID=2750659 RepID=A0A6C2U2U3_PONDE|nr:arylsulfatase [Pontiella desulfatans]SPS73923.1 sulfatase S1_4 [Kiritimatiellales bacterium]VGO14119.1 Arylsulfatase [Pontiella desulfatans]